jgi:Zn-finger nucleic acid-binding protein
MSKSWDERGKSMEEEYFHKKNKEAIEKMRAEKASERAAGHGITCPRGHLGLEEIAYEDVLIDRCKECGGIWLDAGELELLTEREQSGWLGRLFRGKPQK